MNPVLREHISDDASCCGRAAGIVLNGLDESDHRLPQRPPASASPGGIINRKPTTEGLPGAARKVCPCNRYIAGGIAYAQAPEIDHGAQAATVDQKVPSTDISVNPDRRVFPCRAERRVP